MFSKTRKKIIAVITCTLVGLLVLTLATVYVSSYNEVREENAEMLERYVSLYSLDALPGSDPVPGSIPPSDLPDGNTAAVPPGDIPETDSFMLATFYSVAFAEDDTVLAIDSGRSGIYSESQLTDLASDILSENKTIGHIGSLSYQVSDKGSYTLVAFIDNTVTDNSMHTLLNKIVIVVGFAILLFFILSVFLARRIIRPLEENDRKQKQFISDAGHELKTPVSVISTNTELLSRQIGENEWLSNIRYENERMGSLVTSLLDLSRAERSASSQEPVDFSRLVTGEALPFESVAFENGLLLQCDITENITIKGNSSELCQLVSILLDNAIRHAKGSDPITLSLKKDHHQAVLTVSNTGEPIPEEIRSRLFERFFKVDESRNDDGRHYGLGLAIARAIAESHNGTISVSCENQRIIFSVSFPLHK